MQEEVIHPVLITSKRTIGTKEDLNPFAFTKGMNLTFIAAASGVIPPFAFTYKRRKGVMKSPCPGCEFEKKA